MDYRITYLKRGIKEYEHISCAVNILDAIGKFYDKCGCFLDIEVIEKW